MQLMPLTLGDRDYKEYYFDDRALRRMTQFFYEFEIFFVIIFFLLCFKEIKF